VSEGLDFSDLTDDQIVELATALAREALSRNPALAAAFGSALETEQERAASELRAAKAAKALQQRSLDDARQRLAVAQAQEELRQQQHEAMAVFVRKGAALVGRSLDDVTIVWSSLNCGKSGPRLYLNAGTNTEIVTWHLVDYCPRDEGIKVGWALVKQKAELLQWAREATAALEVLRITQITIKGIEL
jgi:hypothetical protein